MIRRWSMAWCWCAAIKLQDYKTFSGLNNGVGAEAQRNNLRKINFSRKHTISSIGCFHFCLFLRPFSAKRIIFGSHPIKDVPSTKYVVGTGEKGKNIIFSAAKRTTTQECFPCGVMDQQIGNIGHKLTQMWNEKKTLDGQCATINGNKKMTKWPSQM